MRKWRGGACELGMMGGWWLEEGGRWKGWGREGGEKILEDIEREGKEKGKKNRKGEGTVSRKDSFTRRTMYCIPVWFHCVR